MDIDARVRDIVANLLRERFANVTFRSIDVEPDEDADGDRILRVRVVFDAERKTLDPRKTLGLIRHLRPRLSKIKEEGFPVLSFIAASELEGEKPAAA
ncbi:MAG TPA: hypothetical protein VFR34_12200 [Paracoccaceae bacterium]|nr:hypothetical protein [Paracoccaceae bacterium]